MTQRKLSDKEQATALQRAIREGKLPEFRRLLRNGLPGKDWGDGLLHLAARHGREQMVALLLESGASPKALDDEGATPLHWCAARGQVAAARVLLEAQAPVNALTRSEDQAEFPPGFTPLMLAARHQQPALVTLLLASGAKVEAGNAPEGRALHQAVLGPLKSAKASAEIVELLLAAGAKVDVPNLLEEQTPLHLAAEAGAVPAVKALLAAGASRSARDIQGRTPAELALAPAVRKLLEGTPSGRAAKVDARDADGATALHRAAQEGKLKEVQRLLDAGANLEARDNNGLTPLQHAIESGRAQVVALLRERGARLEVAGTEGQKNLSLAVRGELLPLLDELKAAGADLTALDKDGQTLLHEAARGGRMKSLRWLLAAGAPLDVQDQSGNTALHSAVATRNNVLPVLAQAGANLELKNRWGRTPLGEAVFKNSVAAARPLLEAGANPRAELNERPLLEYAQRWSGTPMRRLLEAALQPARKPRRG